MVYEVGQLPAGLQIPEANRLVKAGGNKDRRRLVRAGRNKRQAAHVSLMSFKAEAHFAGLGIPEADNLIRARRGEPFAVRRIDERVDGAGVLEPACPKPSAGSGRKRVAVQVGPPGLFTDRRGAPGHAKQQRQSRQ